MLKAFFTIDDEEPSLDRTDIDWLDTVIQTANNIFARIIQEIQVRINKKAEDTAE